MIQVRKASGDLEPFAEEKVILPLQRAGISEDLIQSVLASLQPKLYEGITTSEVYQHIFNLLRKLESLNAGKFSLKRAIMDLGPTGYPFEKFVGAILAHYGYVIQVGVVIPGKCVSHEVDVVAQKDTQHYMIECKFHSQPGTRSDVKVALYVRARYDDLAAIWRTKPGHEDKFHQAWLVTNTKLTTDAIQYGECEGMKLISWNYPEHGSLRELVDNSGLYPITALVSLSSAQKQQLLAEGMILCRDLHASLEETAKKLGFTGEQTEKLRQEVAQLCKPVESISVVV